MELWTSNSDDTVLYDGDRVIGRLSSELSPTIEMERHAEKLVADGWPEGEYRQLTGTLYGWRGIDGKIDYYRVAR